MDTLADLARVARKAQEDAQREAEAPSPVATTPPATIDEATRLQSSPKPNLPTAASTMTVVPPLVQDLRLGLAPPSAGLPLPPLPAAAKSPTVLVPGSPQGSADAMRTQPGSSIKSAVKVPQPIVTQHPGTFVEISPQHRPKTSSTKRLSFSSMGSSKRPIKYGRGRHARTELSPQPSDDDEDPLNWPLWKKDLNLAALLMTVAVIQVMKTAFVSVNVVLEQSFNRSYTAIAALTGAPLIFSACTGMLALVVSRIYGKRPVYLVATAVIFFSSIWNAVLDDFNQALAARIFQGMGWGVFDSLVLGSIHDTYFEHERGLRVAIYQILSVATLWGGPLIGGLVSQSLTSWRAQFQILCGFQAATVLLVALAVPETVFDRAFVIRNTPSTAGTFKQQKLRPRGQVDVEKAKEYLKTMKPVTYSSHATKDLLLQAPRAMIAPTTIMLALVTFLPFSALWAVSSSLSLLFAHLPFNMSPSQIGSLMAGPFVLGMAMTAFFTLTPFWQRIKSCPRIGLIALATGSIMTFVATLTIGLYTEQVMTTPVSASVAGGADAASAAAAASRSSAFMVNGVASNISFPALGVLLGMLAAGAYTVDATVRPTIRRSTSFTSSNLGVALRNTVDMEGAISIWRTLIAGIFVIGMPNLVWSFSVMSATMVGFGVAQLGLVVGLSVVWWRYDQDIMRWDGRVMKLVDLSSLKRSFSYMDVD